MKKLVIITLSAQMLVTVAIAIDLPIRHQNPSNCEQFLIQTVSNKRVAVAIAELAKSIRAEVLSYGHDEELTDQSIDQLIADFAASPSHVLRTPADLTIRAFGREWNGFTPRLEVAIMLASRTNPFELNIDTFALITPLTGGPEIHPARYALMRAILIEGGLNTLEAEAVRAVITKNWHQMMMGKIPLNSWRWK